MIARCPLVRPDQFIQAVRDSGYRSTACALAELLDNSLEAGATRVQIQLIAVERDHSAPGRPAMPRVVEIVVADNGGGMPPDVLRSALQFAGSTRFGERAGLGRFGMGLPSASVSHSLRTEVYSWVVGSQPYCTALDCLAFERREITDIPPATPATIPAPYAPFAQAPSGTVVAWKSLHRVDHDGKAETLEAALRFELGRIFRNFIVAGVIIELNGVAIAPFDPLYLMPGAALPGDEVAILEEHLKIPVPVPGQPDRNSAIEIRFSMLPESWQTSMGRSNRGDRQRRRIDESRGVSVMRAGREIELISNLFKRSHWTDAWYRAEVCFGPELDELFGITNNKQWVHLGPGTPIHSILAKAMSPVLARMAKKSVARGGRRSSPSRLAATLASIGVTPPGESGGPHDSADNRGSLASETPATAPHATRRAIASPASTTVGRAFFRPRVGSRGPEVTLEPSHPFHERFEQIRRRDPAAATLILDLLRTHRAGDVEGWSRRLAEVLLT